MPAQPSRKPAAVKPAKKPAKKPASTRPTNNVEGRWLRVVPPRDDSAEAAQPVDVQVEDPTEAAAVAAGWLLIDAHERLSIAGARRVFGHELQEWHRYTDDTIRPLERPEWSDTATVAQQIKHEEMPTNRLRYRRTMDFVRESDRVFDVGYGRGYLAGLLIRDVHVDAYHGIDIIDNWHAMSIALLKANDLGDHPVTLEVGDLYDLTRERLEQVGATLVICCEVLEHVPDAERALEVLAAALPEGADLLFSVPMHGRIESVFGHVTVFDVARLKAMLDRAGLYAHHVEPLANTWNLIIASRDPAPSVRVREARRRPPVRSSVPLVRHRDFVDVTDMTALDDHAVVERATGSAVRPATGAAYTVVNLFDVAIDATSGVSFAVDGIEGLRLDLRFTDIEHVKRFVVHAYAGTDRVARWNWYLDDGPRPEGVRRMALRLGESTGTFQAGVHRAAETATRVEVSAVLPAGRTAKFSVRAAYLP